MHLNLIWLAAIVRWRDTACAYLSKGWKSTTWAASHPLAIIIATRCIVAGLLVTAYVVGHPDMRGEGESHTEALRSLNLALYKRFYERRRAREAAIRRVRHEVRRAAGLPRWTWDLPTWLAPSKALRDRLGDQMRGIMDALADANPGLTYEAFVDLFEAHWRTLYPLEKK